MDFRKETDVEVIVSSFAPIAQRKDKVVCKDWLWHGNDLLKKGTELLYLFKLDCTGVFHKMATQCAVSFSHCLW